MAGGCVGGRAPLPPYGTVPSEHSAPPLWDLTSTELGYEVRSGVNPCSSSLSNSLSSSVYNSALMWDSGLTYPAPHDAFAMTLPLHDLWSAHNTFRSQCVMSHRYNHASSALVSSTSSPGSTGMGLMPGCGNNNSSASKKARRRVPTMAQRRAANIRERRRMFSLNESFDQLRRKVPTFAYEKRLSRIETLRLAITYISFMTELLASEEANGGISTTTPSRSNLMSSSSNEISSSLLGDNRESSIGAISSSSISSSTENSENDVDSPMSVRSYSSMPHVAKRCTQIAFMQ